MGNLKKALFFSLGLLIYAIGINIFGLKSHFWVYIIALAILVILFLLIATEATLTAYKSKKYELKSYNKWYIYLLLVVLWYFAVFLAEGISSMTRYKLFAVSSNSGNPNIFAGDYVLGDFSFYKYQEPTYGDLVIFSTPNGSYVYRIIGMPNDTLSIENQLVKCTDFTFDVFQNFIVNNNCDSSKMDSIFNKLWYLNTFDSVPDEYLFKNEKRGCVAAMEYSGLGKQISLQNAQKYDFVQFWRGNFISGHSAIFLNWVDEKWKSNNNRKCKRNTTLIRNKYLKAVSTMTFKRLIQMGIILICHL